MNEFQYRLFGKYYPQPLGTVKDKAKTVLQEGATVKANQKMDKVQMALDHEKDIGPPKHPINPFKEFPNIEEEINKFNVKKKKNTYGVEKDEDKPEFYLDNLMSKN